MKRSLTDSKKSIFKKSGYLKGVVIQGHDLSKVNSLEDFANNYKSYGFQASNLHKAIEIIKKMRKEKVKIFLGYTSNMVSSGIRESIRYLVENRLVDALVTTTGGIE